MALQTDANGWDLVIEPPKGWFDLHFKDLWRYRDLMGLFVRRDFVASYKQTILGPLWHIIQPLLTTLMFTVVFGRIAGLPTDKVPQFVFYMAGTTVWSYFANCLTRTSNTFIANAGIFGKVYFPRMVVPVSVVMSQLIAFSIQFTFFLFVYGLFWAKGAPIQPNWAVGLLPLLLLMMAGLGLGFGVIISSLTTKYRDLQVLVGFGVQLWMYATPVIYPLSTMPDHYRWIIAANPLTAIVETFRYGFFGTGVFSWAYLAYSGGFTVLLLLLGMAVFNRVERTFMDTV
ncbi:MAG: ABC transporter permease [Kiritimatiellae bacterium]|nr:ABC transporter permease [Kiritimatiellia bacterium]MDD4341669.1 ABC transporter permease [Kiritimatiellia bacterium]